ncbi:MAG: CRISPR-associated helicase Cas3' [Lachnospiraceae bacterium]|nr:CRISPR-associated helicase Cas3' [Lachnospiraceae bacterium]
MLELSLDKRQLCDIQGRLFELALKSGYDSPIFIKTFMNSRAAECLDDTYDRLQWAGEEYILEELEEEAAGILKKDGELFSREIMYWIGYVYRYWHYYSGESSREIYKIADTRTMEECWLGFHTLDVEMAIDDLKELKRQRSECDFFDNSCLTFTENNECESAEKKHMYYAHMRKKENGIDVERQSLLSHLEETAEIANQRLYCKEYEHLTKAAGMLHDMGKYSDKYQIYLNKIGMGESVVRGSVNHTFAGVIYILEKYHSGNDYELLTSEIIAYAVGAHHGLFDCVDIQERNGFQHRLDENREELEYELARKRFLEDVEEREIEQESQKAVGEVEAFYSALDTYLKLFAFHSNGAKTIERKFTIGIFARMLTSAVMYGDRVNTAEFMQGMEHEPQIVKKDFWSRQTAYLEGKIIDTFSGATQTPINQERQKISDQCKAFTENGDGIYKISVPTGAGKTLSTLRYAYHLAEKTKKQRVIIVIPLLSVLEQNRKVIRDFTEAKDQIGEHHSEAVIENEKKLDELKESQLVSEFWDEPIIFTTMYQFLMNLFSDKTTCITRMSSYANSVIVFDEIQSIPKKNINMFNLAMNFLYQFFHTTILLSSATQPELGMTNHPIHYTTPADIIIKSDKMKAIFKRTEIDLSRWKETMSAGEIADFGTELIRNVSSLLIICNTKAEAKAIYRELKVLETENDYKLFHLSTSMCQEHRDGRLKAINEALTDDKKGKIICVSTQMVEAGVDFSFETVIRVMAGLDNLIQAAGRCNRSGDYGHICEVHLIRYREEKLTHLDDIKRAQDAMIDLLAEYKKHPEKYENDICGEESISYFYRDLFQGYEQDGLFDYKINKGTDTLLELLSKNSKYSKRGQPKERFYLQQAFKEAGHHFTVYDEDTVDVIVPYKEGKEIINDLYTEKACRDIGYRKELFRQASKYTIRLWKNQLLGYLGNDIVLCNKSINDFYTLNLAYYKCEEDGNEDIGFDADHPEFDIDSWMK